MTREEKAIALYCLKVSSDYHSEVCEECIKYPNCDHTIQDDVTETIIKALEQQPSEDCVGRQAVLDTKVLIELPDGQSFYCISPEDVEELPPVTPTRKQGKWIDIHDREEWYGDQYRCSLCGEVTIDNGLYCPNCGAKMEGEE